jgi:Protein of unknown function (DUF3515)
MVDVQTPQAEQTPDRTTRRAALWATAIALPVALVAGLLIFRSLAPQDSTAAQPGASATAAPVPNAPVPMAAPKLNADIAPVCLAVTSQLPNPLRTLPARRVSAGPEQNAAWGEPPITAACGVTPPAMCARADGGAPGCVPLDAKLLVMDGVCWWAAEGPATDVFTTLDRVVTVRVTVPAGYAQSAQWANEFSDPIVRTIKSKTAGVPTGCTG